MGCADVTECIRSNHGWICRKCYRDAAIRGKFPKTIPPGSTICIMPPPGSEGYIMMDDHGVYITLGGVLYLFMDKDTGEDYLDGLKQRTQELNQVKIQKVALDGLFLYCTSHGLNLKTLGDQGKGYQGERIELP